MVVFSTSSCVSQEVLWPMLDLVTLVCLAWINLILHQADAEYTSLSVHVCIHIYFRQQSELWSFTSQVPLVLGCNFSRWRELVQQDWYGLPEQLIQHHAWISYPSIDWQWGIPRFSSHGGFGFSNMLIKFAALEFQLHSVNNSLFEFKRCALPAFLFESELFKKAWAKRLN